MKPWTSGSILTFAFATGLFLSYQNCSPAKFSAMDSSTLASNSWCFQNPSAPECLTSLPNVCAFNGLVVPEGGSVTAYQNSSVPSGQTCVSQTRTCRAGQLDGSYTFSSCTPGAPASCLFNGVTIKSGDSVQAFLSSTVPNGSTCQSQTRTCKNGVLSGRYEYSSCTEGAAASCLFNGKTIPSGQWVQAYQSSTVPYGSSCQSENRLCTNGRLSGSYRYGSCVVGSAASCTFNGQTIPNGQYITAYNSSSVPSGSTCQSQRRQCVNGSFDGDSAYKFPTCSPGAPASCEINGVTIASGDFKYLYKSPTVPSGSTCDAIKRTCNNGVLDGDSAYSYINCTVDQPTCTQDEVLTATRSYVQQVTASETDVASNCIDGANPTLAGNMPEASDWAFVRYMNTCGNRYCVGKLGNGYFDGRVIELHDGLAVLECRRKDPPPTVSDSCKQRLQLLPAPIETKLTTEGAVASACTDSAYPAASDSMPTDAFKMVRFIFTCSARWCRTQGFSTGRMIEDGPTGLTVNCYREEILNQLNAGTIVSFPKTTIDDVSANCVDAAVTTVAGSYPNQSPQHYMRFVNTCGNRYCVGKGYGQSGWVTEILTNSSNEGSRSTTIMCTK